MGVPVEMKDGVAKIGKKDFDKIKDSKGLVKEIRQLIKDFENDVATEASNFLGDTLMKKKKLDEGTLVLGSGGDKVIFKAKRKAEHRIPGKDTVKTKYFDFSSRRTGIAFSKETREVCANWSEQIEKAFFS